MSTKTNYPWQRYSQNKLIVKDEVGKAKPNTYTIPDVAFGANYKQFQNESMKEVLMHQEHMGTMPIRPQRDFITLNRMGIAHKMTNPKECSDFFQHYDARQKVIEGKVREKEHPNQLVFGRKNRTPSPIKDVLCFKYGEQAEKKQEEAYTNRPSTARSRMSVETKASKLLRESIRSKQQIPKENLAKLNQFSNVKGKVRSRY